MKKILSIILIIVALFSLTSCFDGEEEFCYHINYTGKYDGEYFIIESNEELNDFYTTYNEELGLDNIKKNLFNGFSDIYDSYVRSRYFDGKDKLLLIILEENSSEIGHIVQNLSYNDSELTVYIKTQNKKNMTDDMSACLLFIDIPENLERPEITKVTVVVDNVIINNE